MSVQQHIIMKQLIDLSISERLDANDVQERISNLFQQRFLPIIENYLNHLDSPRLTTQIPLLEIDLGVIPVNKLEELFEDRFEEEIAKRIKDIASDNLNDLDREDVQLVTENQTDRVLVACFLETGTFPWWVKEGTLTLFRQALINVIKEDKNEPIRLLRVLFEEPAAIKRLVYNGGDQLIKEIATIAMANNPFIQDAIDEIVQQRIYATFKSTLSTSAFREIWWTEFFTSILHQTSVKSREVPLLIKLLFGLESDFEVQNRHTHKNDLLTFYQDQVWVLNKLLAVFAPQAVQKNVALENLQALLAYFNVIKEYFGLEKTAYTTQYSSGSDFKDKNKKDDAVAKEPTEGASVPKIFSTVKDGLSSVKMENEAQTHDELDIWRKLEESNNNPSIVNTEKLETLPQTQSSYDSDFSDVEKLYIRNAGLVLLWPFLPRFFTNLSLLNGDEFLDSNASAKACLLLQYLVNGNDLELFEPLLPLNKILSGIHIFDAVNIKTELTQQERDMASQLLQAVIHNAPLWKTLSEDALRRAYLQREGILSARDGHWLLQVKRETYDVILDKLPWSVNVVKLPWMENLIFVEWLSI